MKPVEALERIAYLLERAREPTFRVRAFRRAAEALRSVSADRLDLLARQNGLRSLPGVGETIERIIRETLAGDVPGYLRHLEDEAASQQHAGDRIRAALRGDCHVHSDWSDGGSSVREMALAARSLGHQYVAMTDHSPRLAVAKGLSAERLHEQLDLIAGLNAELAPFRILTGIEVDILEDGSLDQEEALLARLDVVVASVHSKLRMEAPAMTQRMVAAVENRHVDMLGHCTGRIVVGRGRPESTFDAGAVFSACARHGKAVEINSRPERLDPPRRLLALGLQLGCRFAVNTDAHAPGQLEWQSFGCERAEECGVPVESIVNAMDIGDLLDWTRSHELAAG